MEPIFQLVLSVGTIVAAAAVAIVVGGRRGLADVEQRTDAETTRLVDALEGRIRLLSADLTDARAKVHELTLETERLRTELDRLRVELDAEKRITARIVRDQSA